MLPRAGTLDTRVLVYIQTADGINTLNNVSLPADTNESSTNINTSTHKPELIPPVIYQPSILKQQRTNFVFVLSACPCCCQLRITPTETRGVNREPSMTMVNIVSSHKVGNSCTLARLEFCTRRYACSEQWSKRNNEQ